MDLLIFVVILTLFYTPLAQSTQEDSDRETLKETYRLLPRVNFSLAFATDPCKITYKLYTQDNPDKKVILNEQKLKNQKIDKSVKTVLFLHGWTADDSSTWYENKPDGSASRKVIDVIRILKPSIMVLVVNIIKRGEAELDNTTCTIMRIYDPNSIQYFICLKIVKVNKIFIFFLTTCVSRYVEAKNNYFQNGPTNVIYIDWSAYGNSSFAVSAANVKPVGKFIANFLRNSMIPPNKIHILGHSMGGQVAAFIGKSYRDMTGKKIGRITGLDPSYRMFSNEDMEKEERLNELDADFVDVVHTNIQIFGYTKPCGHVDFYPNGGIDQPGCPDYEPRDKCNHHRSTKFFVESIITKTKASEVGFKENGYNVELTPVKHPKTVVFGEHIDLKARGVYYFQTSSSKPYLG